MSTATGDVPWYRRWPLVAGSVAVVLLIGVTVAIAWSDGDDGDGDAAQTGVDPPSGETSTPLFTRDPTTQSSTADGDAEDPDGSTDADPAESDADSPSGATDPGGTSAPDGSAATSGSSAGTPAPGATAPPAVVPVPPSVTAYDFLLANPSLSRFLDLVDGSPEFRRVLEEGGPLTVFAPTDDAMSAAGLSDAELASSLALHLVEGEAFDAALLGVQAQLDASDGTAIDVDSSGSTLRVGGAEVVAADNLVNNGEGYVHVVGAVLAAGT